MLIMMLIVLGASLTARQRSFSCYLLLMVVVVAGAGVKI